MLYDDAKAVDNGLIGPFATHNSSVYFILQRLEQPDFRTRPADMRLDVSVFDTGRIVCGWTGRILSVFFALIVHSELKSVNPGFPVAFIF